MGFIIGSFVLLIESANKLSDAMYYPSVKFPIYIVEIEIVSIEFKNVLMVSILISLVITLVLQVIGLGFRKYLKEKGLN